MNFSSQTKAWIKLVCLILTSGGGVIIAAHAGGASIGWAIFAGLITAGTNVYHALGDSPADAGGPPALQSGGGAAAILIALCLLGATVSSRSVDVDFLKPLATATNWAPTIYATHFDSNDRIGGGALVLYNIKVADTRFGVSAGLGADWAGRWRLFNGDFKLQYPIHPFADHPAFTVTPFGLVAAGTPLGGAGRDNGTFATAEGGGIDLTVYKGLHAGGAWINRTGCGDFSQGSEEVFLSIRF